MKENRDVKNILEEINKRMEILVKITSAQFASGSTQRENILKLRKLKIKPKDIAEILGTTPKTVSVTTEKTVGTRKKK